MLKPNLFYFLFFFLSCLALYKEGLLFQVNSPALQPIIQELTLFALSFRPVCTRSSNLRKVNGTVDDLFHTFLADEWCIELLLIK
jgi:hypothetical protein